MCDMQGVNNNQNMNEPKIYINKYLITPDMYALPMAEVFRRVSIYSKGYVEPVDESEATCVSYESFRKLIRYLKRMEKLYRSNLSVEIEYFEGTWYCFRKQRHPQ